ncbi:MAG: hypothetical protein RSB57_10425 [Hungatella sp.]
MKRSVLISVLILSGTCMLYGCKTKTHDKIDLSSIHTSAAQKLPTETMSPSTEATTTVPETSSIGSDPAATSKLTTTLETYTADQISIQYPVVSNLADTAKQTAVNELLKKNALSFCDQFLTMNVNVNVSVLCEVTSLDQKRMTAVYTGAYTVTGGAYPVNVFYSNTVDLTQAKNLGFHDYSDAYTMAGYVMSADCKFYEVSSELEKALLDYRATQSLDFYTKLLEAADFSAANKTDFPESFSYVKQGVLYFSIPVPHALGDYALVYYSLDGK